jgi:translocation protein SEC63
VDRHPDKNQGDNKEEAEVKYVEIGKAYKTLTDPEIYQNWVEYGNPDGRQSFSFGIALPAWIVDPSNSMVVLMVYALLFGFALPYAVSRWWSGSKKYTKDGVLNYTMGIYFQEMKEGISTKKMLELLCASMEFKEEVPSRENDKEAVMALFRKVKDVVYTKTGEKLELPHKYNAPYCYKAFTLLYAHLFRVPIDDAQLQEDAYAFVPKFVHLTMRGLLQISAARSWLPQSLNCLEISRMVIQAVPSAWNHMESSDLMQLPYFSATLVKHLRNRKKPIKSIAQLMALAPPDRVEMLKTGGLDDVQVKDVLTVAREYPIVTIDKAFFECAGEKEITPNSLIAFVLRLKAVKYEGEPDDAPASPLTAKKTSLENNSDAQKPAVEEEDDLADDEDDFDDEGNPRGTKRTSRLTKLLTGAYWTNPNKPVHCPYFANVEPGTKEKRPTYLMFLTNPRNNRIIGNPTYINNLVAKSYSDATGPGGYRTVKFRFQAPPQAGTYVFGVLVSCDALMGIELRQEVRLTVVDPPKDDDEESRAKMVKDAWRDLEEEERLERELGLSQFGGVNPNMSRLAKQMADEAEDDDDTDTSSDSSDEDE